MKIEPDTEIKVAFAIGGAEASAIMTIVKAADLADLQRIASERIGGIAGEAFEAFTSALEAGVGIAKTVSRHDDDDDEAIVL